MTGPARTLWPDRLAVAGLHALGLALLALHAYVRTFPPTPTPLPADSDPEGRWWGLWPVIYLPAWLFWSGAAAVIGLMVWGWWALRRESGPDLRISARARRAVAVALLLTFLAAFFAFPIAHTRWGDAYLLTHALAWPDPALRLTHSWQAPLDVYLHGRLWALLHGPLGWQDAMPVYRLLSPLAGLLYLAAALGLAAEERIAPGWLAFGLLASLGLIQLFFGYVENYSFAAAGVLLYLWLGPRTLAGRTPLWAAALALALTHAMHPSTVVLAPSLLYLGWVEGRRQRMGTAAWARVVLAIGLPMLGVAVATFLLMEAGGHGVQALLTSDRPGGGDARWFVPLWATTTRWEHYTLASWPHLRDLLNGQVLVAPVVLPSLIWLGIATKTFLKARSFQEGGSEGHAATRFFAVAALGYLAFIAVWNPDYGGQRDWDLFSLAALPLTGWLAALAGQRLPRRVLGAGFAPLLLLQALHTAAWVYQNTLPWEWP
jgi:hypothetical protein